LLQEQKCALAKKTQATIDKHTLYLDKQIKVLQDKGDFPADSDVPSLLRPQAPDRSLATRVDASGPSMPMREIHNSSSVNHAGMPRLSGHQVAAQRIGPAQVGQQANNSIPSAAPTTPGAAAMLLNRQARESSAGAANKRQRTGSGIGSLPTNSSGLARHASIGPGTPKVSTPTARAGSAGPRSSQQKAGSKKVAPHKQSSLSRRIKPGKSGLSRIKRTGNKNSPGSTNDSELSEAESGSGDEDDEVITPPVMQRDAEGDEEMLDLDDDEGGDDKKYCTCQSVSYGDMVACDNESCPYEWFHWTCVGLKSEPVGIWICPVCAKNMKK